MEIMYKYYKEIKNNSSSSSNDKRYCHYRVEDNTDCSHPVLYISKSKSGIIIKSIGEYEFSDFFIEDYASGRIVDSTHDEFEEALMTSIISLNIGELK